VPETVPPETVPPETVPPETVPLETVPPAPAAVTWVQVATLDDLWEGEMAARLVGDLPIVILNVGGQVVAYEDRCPHLGSQLSEGRFDGTTLTCRTHEWMFDAAGGEGINPMTVCLRRLAVRVNDDIIHVNIPGPR
jgi:toluene monooxygenase system ferredoxin subunit